MVWDRSKIESRHIHHWEDIPCPVCDGQQFTELFRKHGEPFVQCNDCGLILINPRPIHAEVLETYDADYSKGYVAKAASKRRRSARWVGRMRARVPAGRWLDVGCSAGFIVEAARNAGYDAWGVDVEAWGVGYARDTLGLANVRVGALEAQGFAAGSFDVISAYEVIEHVPDLNAFLAELKRLLAPNGVIVLHTPDVGHWRRPKDLASWEAIIPSEHLYYFSRATLARLVEKHGLSVAHWGFTLKPGLRATLRHAPP